MRILIPNVSSHVAIHQSGQGKRAHQSMTTPPIQLWASQQHSKPNTMTEEKIRTDVKGESDNREVTQLYCKSTCQKTYQCKEPMLVETSTCGTRQWFECLPQSKMLISKEFCSGLIRLHIWAAVQPFLYCTSLWVSACIKS